MYNYIYINVCIVFLCIYIPCNQHGELRTAKNVPVFPMSPVVRNSDPNALSGIAAGRLHTEPTVAAAHQFECIHSDQPWDNGKISKVN